MRDDTKSWIDADWKHGWHPFTPYDAWVAPEHEPLMIVRGEGVWLWDSEGRRYLDGNSSIWTNIHGHARAEINRAIIDQLGRIAHSSYLGAGHPWGSELAARLAGFFPQGTLERVFFSDDGSTAVEVALKMAMQFRMQTGEPQRQGFVAFENGYHGDTLGAASLGGVARFFDRFRGLGPEVRHVSGMAGLADLDPRTINAVVIEPLIQGVNEMRVWPPGMLAELRQWCDASGVLLILDEVMTGFGRTGTMFACQQEDVIPDFLCLAKGLSGGYLPLAATLTTAKVHDAFRGGAERAFYYGHSFTANPLGCAAALASLDLFESDRVLERLPGRIARIDELLAGLASRHPRVAEIRRCGMISGIALQPVSASDPRDGTALCLAARRHGLLTRAIRDTLVLMPPLCVTEEELEYAVSALDRALAES
jgi:adenosylmethionine-8-amino-7-oxononanoate aminotransferase